MPTSRAFALLCVLACFGASMALMYDAGCTGDLKTGSYGDMAEALRLETRASIFGSIGAVLAALTASSWPGLSPIQRALVAICVIVVSFVGFLLSGVFFEISGVQACVERQH